MRLESYIRSIARSSYWQQLYRSSKEIHGINLFENTNNLSGLQVIFLYWLKVYDLLYNELASKEWINLDEDVIKDEDRCDAFLYWRRKEIEKETYKNKKEMKQSKQKKKGMREFSVYKGGKK